MSKHQFNFIFALGALVVIWMGASFVGSNTLALAMIILIGMVYALGFAELLRYRRATRSLGSALSELTATPEKLDNWLSKIDTSLHNAIKLRISGERVGLPLPVLTPYLVGLLVMLGLLGTFAGMVGTLKGAVFALEGTTELQAIREGLAAPMKGLGLAFGTSVAGVAASAVLGLLSTLARRERFAESQQLDDALTSTLRPFTLTQQREATYQAMQAQAAAFPALVEKLGTMADNIENMGQTLADQLHRNQQDFFTKTEAQFGKLAQSVDESLKGTLAEGGKLAGESIQPIVRETMVEISSALRSGAEETQKQFSQTAKDQLESLSSRFTEATQRITEQFNTTSQHILSDIQSQNKQGLSQQHKADEERLNAWTKQLEEKQSASNELQTQTLEALIQKWEHSSETQAKVIGELSEQVQHHASQINSEWQENNAQAKQQAEQLLAKTEEAVAKSESLIASRLESEQNWLAQQREQAKQFNDSLRAELNAQREDEAIRSAEAIERLGALEAVVTEHLGKLGSALEDPMTRLIETASETPKAAAEVIGQLRQEVSNNIERDNQLLEERQNIILSLNKLFEDINRASENQREAIDQLVNSSADTLANVGKQFTDQVNAEVDKLAEAGEQFSLGATDIASLGDAFGHAVSLFGESNQHMIQSLQQIELSIQNSHERSEEQLTYYIAQAREIIDHNLLAQKEIFDQLGTITANKKALETEAV